MGSLRTLTMKEINRKISKGENLKYEYQKDLLSYSKYYWLLGIASTIFLIISISINQYAIIGSFMTLAFLLLAKVAEKWTKTCIKEETKELTKLYRLKEYLMGDS